MPIRADEYRADLIDVKNDKIIPVIIQKGGGHCDWTALEATKKEKQWEIQFVGSNKPDIKDWAEGDEIILGIAIL